MTSKKFYHMIATSEDPYCSGEPHCKSVFSDNKQQCVAQMMQWFKKPLTEAISFNLKSYSDSHLAYKNADMIHKLEAELQDTESILEKIANESLNTVSYNEVPQLIGSARSYFFNFYLYELTLDSE